MKIISNTCIGAALQRDCLKQEYNNPFCWCRINYESMYNLIKDFNIIDFSNFELIKDDKWNFSINIEKRIKIDFPHYKFDSHDKTIRKNREDLYYNKIWEYIVEKYKERLDRMIDTKENPIFIVGSIHKVHLYNDKQIKSICDLCTKKCYKLVIVNNNMDFSKEFPTVKFVKTKFNEKQMNNVRFAKEIYPQIKEYINANSLSRCRFI